jgi:hypothetical protein
MVLGLKETPILGLFIVPDTQGGVFIVPDRVKKIRIFGVGFGFIELGFNTSEVLGY